MMTATQHLQWIALVGPLVCTGAACRDHECTLDSGPLLELELVRVADAPVSAVVITGMYGDSELPSFGCGDPDVLETSLGDGCHRLWVPIPEPSTSATATLAILANGYEQRDITAVVRSDGCHLLPEQVIQVDLSATTEYVCEAWCDTDVRCTADVDWDRPECVDFCVGDISGTTADDACDSRYADLYLCEAQLSCEQYSGSSSACSEYERAIDTCEG